MSCARDEQRVEAVQRLFCDLRSAIVEFYKLKLMQEIQCQE